MTNASRASRPPWAFVALAAAMLGALVAGGCQSAMYGGTPDDGVSGSIAPAYAPGTYEPPAKIGGAQEEAEPQAQLQSKAEPQYEYRGGRDPVTGRAKTQM